MSEDVVIAHAELPSVCEHIHLPLQSGSSRILKAMRRTYDRGRYMDRVALIREHVPDCAITTDIIVGFPGETEADFEETLEVAEEVGYDGAFTFIYSPRRGTEAATMTDEFIPHDVAVERMERLVEVIQRRARERAQRFVGRTLDVLVEGTLATRRRPPPRPHPPQQGRQLRRPRVTGRDRARRDHRRHEPDAHRRDVAAGPRHGLISFRRQRMRTYVRALGITDPSKPPTIRACRASPRTSSSAGSTPRRPSTPASTRSAPSPRSTACQRFRGSRSSGR